MKITAVLLEVASIQKYVFSSNKLKESLGASYLIENIFKYNLETALEEISLGTVNLDEWRKSPGKVSICGTDIEMEVGYIGGGNAMLFFKDAETAVELAKQWSKRLLIEAPGLMPSIAINKNIECADLSDKDKFQPVIGNLFRILSENKYENQPQTTLPRHGITAECSHTGLSGECYDKDDNIYISSVAKSKIANVEKAKNEMKKKFRDVLKDKYDFPAELDKLGQNEGDNYISIVHIDGNGMGKRFQSCRTLEEIRNLSRAVHEATERSFIELLGNIIQNYGYFEENFRLSNNMLPIRPIIMGGDDVTFVSHGKLGVYFAEIFMKAFTGQKVSDKSRLSSCAGIAITKTKYPFYRGYNLAEKLCSHAKKNAREEEGSSWLDFHIAYGGFSGSIEDIRKKNYSVSERNLCLRPYRVVSEKEDYQNLSECIKGIRYLKISDQTKWPNSKLSELREALGLGIPAVRMFLKEMAYRGRFLPDVKNQPECRETGWISDVNKTPYFDMLELMEFYPVDLGGNK
ncbi:MAG: hypothetical protein OIN66_08695 [Candidatus Methanoperedens sp.]|nr:hypothetical protein [Candidatus Methanoperedens sp.]